jgi:hypothetical protein
MEELEGFGAVADDVKIVRDPGLVEGLLRETDIPRVVLDQQDADRTFRDGATQNTSPSRSMPTDSVRPRKSLVPAGGEGGLGITLRPV